MICSQEAVSSDIQTTDKLLTRAPLIIVQFSEAVARSENATRPFDLCEILHVNPRHAKSRRKIALDLAPQLNAKGDLDRVDEGWMLSLGM